jgi:phospholipid/cholesterol/gamma-HCH transport system substrate-binding protein
MKYAKEIKVAVVVVISIALLIYGLNYLKGVDVLERHRQYYAVYDQIEGLLPDNAVQINGFKVGKVNKIIFHPDNSGRIVVGFVVSGNALQIPKNSVARISSLDLLGSKAISIELGNSVVNAEPGDTLLPAIQASLQAEVNKQVQPLKEKAEALISSIDSVMIVVQTVFNKNARENLTKSFESIQRAIETFERTSLRLDTLMTEEKQRINDIMRNIDFITKNIRNSNDQLTNIINNISVFSDSLVKADIVSTIEHTDRAMTEFSGIIERINKGEGTAGMLVKNDSLYRNLERSAGALDNLLRDMEKNPKRYVHFSIFGRKDKKEDKK